MKFLSFLCVLFTASFQLLGDQPHEFEGVSEIYNIRNLKVLQQYLPEHPVIIEGGAYKGRDTIKLAQKLPSATIYSFEPLETALPELMQEVQNYSNVTVINKALDKTSGKKKFYVCHGTYGQSPIFEFHSSLLKPTGSAAIHLEGPIQMVESISLQEFCKNNHISTIDMLWLSTEGNELQILKGAQDLIKKTSLVYVRTHLYPSRIAITHFSSLKQFMEKNGFIMLSHFYLTNIHGDALFVNTRVFN